MLSHQPLDDPQTLPGDAPGVYSAEPLSEKNFNRLAAVIQQYCGIKMPPVKRAMLEGRLRRRMRAVGVHSANDYCKHVFEDGGLAAEMVHLIDAVTTNKTDFFREPGHFTYLQTHALPSIAAQGRQEIKLWSAACSTGEEPYTLAMVLEEFCRGNRNLRYSILATDISTEVLGAALSGRYPEAVAAPIPMEIRRRHLMRSRNSGSGEIRVAPHLRAKVSFARLNLMDDSYPVDGGMDVIFCRNILIYFDRVTQAKVLTRLCSHLRVGGYLVLGHSDFIAGIELPVTTLGNTIFQRR